MNGNTPVKDLTTKQLVWICVTFFGLLSGMQGVHSYLVVPSILHQVDDMIERKTVSRNEWNLVLKKLDDLTFEVRELRRARD